MSIKCKICEKDFNSLKGFHTHLSKSHDKNQQDYYITFYPKIDLFDGSLISYKNYEQYFSSDFNLRENFVQWYLQNPTKEKVDYCIKNLLDRLKLKKTTILPSQVELKGLFIPTISGFEYLFKDIRLFLRKLTSCSIVSRFNYEDEPIVSLYGPFTIYEDTREQKPLDVKANVKKMKLSVGDYTISQPYFSDVFVERKSLDDLVSTLSSGLDRFEREIARAKKLNGYIVVLIESFFSDCANYSPKTRFTQRINGSYILHKMRYLMSVYDNIQFVFGGTRQDSADMVVKILRMGEQAKKFDLEFLKDKGYFNVDRRRTYFTQGQNSIVG